MGIFLRQSHNIKPTIWGSPADRQYAIWRNMESIYKCDPDDEVLIMPLFWGLPPLDYSGFNNHGTNHGAAFKDGSLDFDTTIDNYIDIGTISLADNTAWSISMWIKDNDVDSVYGLWGNIFQTGEKTRALIYSGGYFLYRNDADNGGQWGIGTFDNTMTHFTLVCDGTDLNNLRLCVNNVDKGTKTLADSSQTIKKLASYGSVSSGCWDGIIDEVRIAKVGRTADQIALFHDRPWDLYRSVARPIWSIPSGLTLTIAAIDSAGLLDSVNLTQKHNLAVQELSGMGSLDNISLTQKHLLVLQELLSSGALDNVALIQKHLLSVQALSGAGTLENVELTQKHILALQDLSSSGTLDNIVLELSTLLVVADLISDGFLDNISLTQKHNLVVQELLSSGELDNITLSVSTLLIVAEMISSGALDSVNLTQKHTIAVQELLSSGALDDLALTQKHLLVVQELLSAGAIDNIELLVATLLTVSDMLSTGAIDNTALTQKHILSINEVMSAGQIDGLALTQKHLLIIDSLISSGIVDNIRFDIAAGLIYISLSEATEYNISLSEATEYNISLSEATEYNISLSEAGGGA